MAARRRSKIRIKKSHRGLFTRKAKRAGRSVAAHARHVLRKGSKASTKTKRQAVFARNAKKWKHKGRRKKK